MATQFVNLDNLTLFKSLYDTEVADAIATAEARSLHTVAISGQTLNFYREEEPVGAATPAYSITLPTADLSNLIPKISGATGSKIAATAADGTVTESNIAIADVATKSYADTAASTAASSAVQTFSATLADVATSGDAGDVDYDNTTSGLTATDVQAAIDEIAAQSAGGVGSKTVYLRDESAGQSAYAKVYTLYQGASASDMSQNTNLGSINIPKDLVVQSGHIVTVEDGVDSDGDTTSEADGTYIKLVIQNQTTPIYINVADLVDAYTAQQNATQVQLAISATNEISATIVAGSIGSTELASNAVTTAKITDGNVTKVKLATSVQDSLDLADSALQASDIEAVPEASIRALFS